MSANDIKTIVRQKYGEAARRVIEIRPTAAAAASCCGGESGSDPITRDLYDAMQVGEVPEAAVLASLGCGNPTALAELKPGEVVLDLASTCCCRRSASAPPARPTGST